MGNTTKHQLWAQRYRVMIARIIWLLLAIYVFGYERQAVQSLTSTLGIIGIITATLGVAIRSISAGILQKNEFLATSGIYAVVRNPLYLGSLLILTGINIIIFHPLVAIVSIALYSLTYIPTILSEEAGLRYKYGSEWEAYAQKTPRLLPNISQLGELNSIQWSVTQWYRNHEHNTVIAMIAMLILLFLYNHYWAM